MKHRMEETLGMTNPITICADDDIVEAIESAVRASCPSFFVRHRVLSYPDCLGLPGEDPAGVFILQARPPITQVDDLLYALQGASPVYILFQIVEPGQIRFATTLETDPLAASVAALFQAALAGRYACKQISIRTTLLCDEMRPNAEAVVRHESLMEILRGCSRKEFLFYREEYGLNLKDNGYYLFFWELMGVEFADHESNKYIYNFSGEMLLRECYEIINGYNGGEVFYSTPNLLCIILNDLDLKSESGKQTVFEEMIRKLAHCTGNRVACRYLSDRAEDIKGLRCAYERYHADKSVSFFVRDMIVMRPALIEARRRYTEQQTINALLHEIADFLRYDLHNPALEDDLHRLYFEILKPAMSFTLYYSSMTAVFNAMAEVRYAMDSIMPNVNNRPNLLQYTSIEEQYDILMRQLRELQKGKRNAGQVVGSLVRKAVNYIHSHYKEDITVPELAGSLFISGVHLSQIFKREMGMSVIKYLIDYRVEQAKGLLRDTDEFIYAISEQVGFREFRHFSRTFRELTGLSPTQYRKRFRSK